MPSPVLLAPLALPLGAAGAGGFAAAWSLPFAAILLSIAVLPLAAPHLWETNRAKAAITWILAAPVLGLLALRHRDLLAHALVEYAQFVALLGALFVVSGGILVRGDVEARPRVNAAILLLGALLANVVGTTGASMLLIRPLLRINQQRKHVVHTVVFFIFLVSNVGGCLTPLGDPPLFLGFLDGVPFTWTLRLWKEWAVMTAALLAIYAVADIVAFRRETAEDHARDSSETEPVRIEGLAVNGPLLLGIVASAALLPSPWREGAMLGAILLSMRLTPATLREENGFDWHPIAEVAILFAAIFVAMAPTLATLRAKAPALCGDLGISAPWHFFVTTGTLSSFLDNAPTYKAFVSVAAGLNGIPEGVKEGGFLAERHADFLAAISLGAVFMGANTYIGNGPNFMVKSIAESRGVKLPSFFGYMVWSVGILGPLFGAIIWLFL